LEQLAEVLKELGDSGVLFVFTGSCPPGLEAGDFEKLLSDCQTSGARLAIDTSGEPLRRAAKLPPYLIKPNLLELGELLGRGLTEHEEAIEEGRKLAASIPVVVVTLGAGGAYCFTDGKVWGGQTRLPAERIRSTVGCGDTFLAAFLAGLLEKDGTPETALAKALAISGASAMTQGPGEFTSELVREAERVTEVAAFD
jgi:1-phosphofructokinase